MTNYVPTITCSYCNEPTSLIETGELIPFALCKACQETFLKNRHPEEMEFLMQELQNLSDKTDHPILGALFYLDYERLFQERYPEIESLCERYEPIFQNVWMRFSPFFGKIFYQLGQYFLMHGEVQQAYDAIDQSISCMNASIYHNGTQDPTDLEGQLAKAFHALAFLERQMGNTEQGSEWNRVASAYSHLQRQTADALLLQTEEYAMASPASYRDTIRRMADNYDGLADRLEELDPIRNAILRRQAKELYVTAQAVSNLPKCN